MLQDCTITHIDSTSERERNASPLKKRRDAERIREKKVNNAGMNQQLWKNEIRWEEQGKG